MSYCLQTDEPVASGIRRIAREQLAGALCQISQVTDGKEAAAVHATRKHIKKIRALLRLIRQEIGQGIFQEEDQRARGVARAFSGSRDARVQLQLLEKLASSSPPGQCGLLKNQLGAGKGNGGDMLIASARDNARRERLCRRSAIGWKAGRWMIWGWTISAARYAARIGVAEKACAARARNRPPKISTPYANG